MLLVVAVGLVPEMAWTDDAAASTREGARQALRIPFLIGLGLIVLGGVGWLVGRVVQKRISKD